jgi:hypothetical protein
MTPQIEVVTRRELLRTTRRRHWYAVSGFAPFVFNGKLHAGFCTAITAVERRGSRHVRYVEWPALYREEGEAGA